ncbi:MAG: hypothetical protein ACTSUH_06060 [Candidatus Thorarchaeota archaeon]
MSPIEPNDAGVQTSGEQSGEASGRVSSVSSRSGPDSDIVTDTRGEEVFGTVWQRGPEVTGSLRLGIAGTGLALISLLVLPIVWAWATSFGVAGSMTAPFVTVHIVGIAATILIATGFSALGRRFDDWLWNVLAWYSIAFAFLNAFLAVLMGFTGSWTYTYTIAVGGAVEAAIIAGCLGRHMRNTALPWLSGLTAFLFAAGAIAQITGIFAVPQGGLMVVGTAAVAARPLAILIAVLFYFELRACR